MPFVATISKPGEEPHRAEIESFENPRFDLRDYTITCPACGAPMHVRHSILDTPYFQHNPDPEGSCDYSQKEPESPEHKTSKRCIIKALQGHAAYKGAEFFEEMTLQTANRRRVADVFVRHADGRLEIHEAQLSGITPTTIHDRTSDYMTVPGVEFVLWWLGNHADGEQNRRWCQDNYGVCAQITVQSRRKLEVVGSYTERVADTN